MASAPTLPPLDVLARDSCFATTPAVIGSVSFALALALAFPTCCLSATQSKTFLALCALVFVAGALSWAFSVGGAAWAPLVPDECAEEGAKAYRVVLLTAIIGPALVINFLTVRSFQKRIEAIEGALPVRLADGSLRLLRVEWLLQQPADWVLKRRQDLPDAAFWSGAQAVRLLRQGRVAALSYRWLGPFNAPAGGGDQPDGERFHLERVLAYFRIARHARAHSALMWDFAAVPQHDPITGARRTEAENQTFKQGLGVMSNVYASPRVLVLQQKRMPAALERELHNTYCGAPPADRVDLVPYAGARCRSGWCTSETACALLMTRGGGHVYELGVGRLQVTRGRLPSMEEMERLFHAESTRFIGSGDREQVMRMYKGLRTKLEEYDAHGASWLVRNADRLLTSADDAKRKARQWRFRTWPLIMAATFVGVNAWSIFEGDFALDAVLVVLVVCAVGVLAPVAFYALPSRILREHLDAMLSRRPAVNLEHSFHWSLAQPPFRPRPRAAGFDGGSGASAWVPACFVPRHESQELAEPAAGAGGVAQQNIWIGSGGSMVAHV